jgi:hypothetical protein
MKKLFADYGPKDWGIAFLVATICYLAGEVTFWALGIATTEPSLLYRVLERTFFGVFPLAIVALPLLRVLSGNWSWQKASRSIGLTKQP